MHTSKKHLNTCQSVQSLSRVLLFATPWSTARQASLSITNSQTSPKLISIELVMPSNYLILCHPLLLLSSMFPSIRGLFKWVSSLHQVDKVLELQLQHQSFQWTPRTDLLRVSLQSKGLPRVFSNTTVQKHQFFGAQLSSQSNSHIHPWPPEKTIALTRRTFVGKVMSLLLNMLSRLVITFLPRSKHLLISWLQSPSAVILEPKK